MKIIESIKRYFYQRELHKRLEQAEKIQTECLFKAYAKLFPEDKKELKNDTL